MKTCSLCKKSGHNRRTCKEPIENIQIITPSKVSHKEANSYKSNNGNALENMFIKRTGIKKSDKSLKPIFVNEHNIKQEIDFDFTFNIKEQKIFLDLTTSYRTDRMKQKAYNALLLKKSYQEQQLPIPKFIIGVGSLNENGKQVSTKLIEGIDEIKSVEEIIKEVLDGDEESS